jgi:hypothetical protein
MCRALVVVIAVISLVQASCTLGGLVIGAAASYSVDITEPPPPFVPPVAPTPTPEQLATCEKSRARIAAVAATRTSEQRAALLAGMPNCADPYAVTNTQRPPPYKPPPPVKRTESHSYIVHGLLVGLLLDALAIAAFVSSCIGCNRD